VDNKFERRRWWFNFRHYPEICLEELKKTIKNLRIFSVPANFRTGHFLNTHHKLSREEGNIKMELTEIVCTGLDWTVKWRTSVEKIMNFLVTWKQVILWPVSFQHGVCMVMWALLSVCMFHNLFYSEDNFLLGRYGVEFGR
jgi:hypothetical protein